MALCNARYYYLLVDIGAIGSASDGGTFAASGMKDALYNGPGKKLGDVRDVIDVAAKIFRRFSSPTFLPGPQGVIFSKTSCDRKFSGENFL